MGTLVPIMGKLNKSGETLGSALFGTTRQAVLRLVFDHPARRFYTRQIITLVGQGSGAVQRELAQLTQAGIISRTVEGRQTYYQANSQSPVFNELRGLIRKTFGAPQLLRNALAPLAESIEAAFIYGSLASGKETEASDVDLMLIGEMSLDEVLEATSTVQDELQREINPSLYRLEEFRRKVDGGHHFLTSVLKAPKIFLIGSEDELTRLVEKRVAKGAPNKRSRDR